LSLNAIYFHDTIFDAVVCQGQFALITSYRSCCFFIVHVCSA